MTKIMNLATGESRGVDLQPNEAVRQAHEQGGGESAVPEENGAVIVSKSGLTVRCGDWVAWTAEGERYASGVRGAL